MLLFASVTLAGCSDNGWVDDFEVKRTFIHVVEDRSISRDEQSVQAKYYQYWGITALSFGLVRPIGDADSHSYEIAFTDPDDGKKELWVIDMDTQEVRPIDFGALFTAILLFCEDRSDLNPDCRSYFRITDRLRNP